MLKTEELRAMAVEELQDKVNKLKKELLEYRFQAKTGKLERQSVIRETKTDIARLLTILREKERDKVKA